MKKRARIHIMMMAAVLSVLISACGGGGGGASSPALPTVTVSADKNIALANSTEDITLTAVATYPAGAAVADKTISFLISAGSGSLHSADATTDASGVATVKINRAAVAAPATSENVTVAASAEGGSGSVTVKFINLPATATVQVGLNKAVSDLAFLTFDLISTPTQTVSFLGIEPIGAAIADPFVGPAGPVQTSFTWQVGVSTYAYMTSNIPGLAVTANSAFIGFTYGIDPGITELPTFTIGQGNINADSSAGFPILPALAQSDFFATTVFDTE